ncbi:glutathione binding-like protein [Polynucleobacter necessarius]|uniref:glutathione binding-like protein n=1 Tax=Polynucleobacter necessarius TaxID=576610 RepID=UPI000E09D161|nr:glutathione binding-like protein [Polynucleobacter necessarius]
MIDVYSWPTSNDNKVHIMREECRYRLGRDWIAHPIDIDAGDQFTPEFLKISPHNKIPAIVDPNGPDGKPISRFESGAILLYLASKTGKFLPEDTRGKYEVLQWLMFQMGGLGPMLGQNHHCRLYAPEKIECAINRYTNEAKCIYGVLDGQLKENPYIAGKTYSIAGIAIYPWTRNWKNQGIDINEYSHFKRWFEKIGARPAVKRGCEVLTALRKPLHDDKAREQLFGSTQYRKRK